MAKKCIICGAEAKFCIKNSSESYCRECAELQFGDLDYLQKVETQAMRLKRYLKDKDAPNYDGNQY